MKTKATILSICTAALLCSCAHQPQSPKYIFYFIGDGMGMGPAMAAEMYNRTVLNSPESLTMFQFPVAGMAMTYSASSPVTDSAAAGTALSTGTKTNNGMLGMDPDTTEIYSFAKHLFESGYGVGVVTSVAPDDATPAAFYAHVPHRSQFYEIGVQAAQSGYQFISGAALRGLAKDGQETDLLDVMAENNVAIAYGTEQLDSIDSERVLLLNYPDKGTSNDIGYTIDSIEGTLTLPVITQACLDHLMKVSPDKFFMMVEGGNIDHALHANDGAAAIKEIINFNQAIAIAYEFYKQHPDETLIVVTADHDTAGMTIGNRFVGYNAFFEMADYQKVSKETFERYCSEILKEQRPYSWDDMKEYLSQNFGFWGAVPVKEFQEKQLKEKFDAVFKARKSDDERTLYFNFNGFVREVFKVYNDAAGFGFVATSHTGNPVPVFAVGVDAYDFANLNNNIDIPAKILQIVQGKTEK